MASPSLQPLPSNYSAPSYGPAASPPSPNMNSVLPSAPSYGPAGSPPSPNMNSAHRYGVPMAPNSSPLPYDPFSDKSIQKSIDSMKKDADDVIKHYDKGGRRRPRRMPTPIPNISESSIDFNDLPYNIKSIVQKYDEVWEYAKNEWDWYTLSHSVPWTLFENFWTSDKKGVYLYTLYSSINERILKLENYLKTSENHRKSLYPRRSYPNGEINIGIVPYEKTWAVAGDRYGGRHRRRTRRHKKSHKKTRRVRNNRR
jgi:hypothetical protein